MSAKNHKVVLITGAARRIGACIAEVFHANNYNVIVHYRHSKLDAQTLVTKLNQRRENSAIAIYADLDDASHYEKLIRESVNQWKRLDVLINNASTFTPTPIGKITQEKWDYLFNSNLKAPFFLSQAAAPFLSENKGNIINIVDVHAITPMQNYSIYSCAKAGLFMLTKSLALELAPAIRVNAIAPGNVIWPENENVYSDEKKQSIIQSTLLKKQVDPKDIAETALFLANQMSITAQMINIDAGKFV
ncbi:MAG TPA: pteridine reductase [Coxiellaceae bacterium]|nr:MAG: hypothetical protein A3E81_08585 [Gammaproteobacteria bacterium RIFCSPHIGHO2_12_FULL_36_30]HLB55725.1 pteridine reductase [Coxiellaceae bacterium]